MMPDEYLPESPLSLRALREAKGLTLDEVAANLKHPASRIQALEESRWDALPKGIALRGMIRNYARLLGVDGQALVQQLAPMQGQNHAGLAESVLAKGVPNIHERAQFSTWVWLFTILLVCGVVFLYAAKQGWLPIGGWLNEAVAPRTEDLREIKLLSEPVTPAPASMAN